MTVFDCWSAKIRHFNMSVLAVGNCVGHFLLLFFDVSGTKRWIEKIIESCSSKVIINRWGSRFYLMSWGARKDLLTSNKAVSLTDRHFLIKGDLLESGTWAASTFKQCVLNFVEEVAAVNIKTFTHKKSHLYSRII